MDGELRVHGTPAPNRRRTINLGAALQSRRPLRLLPVIARHGCEGADLPARPGTDEYLLQDNAELGFPWRTTDLWLRLSYPFFHSDRIKTPTLFLGSDKDFNVPVAGGEQMYAALRTRGVPTQLIVYRGQFHELTRPSYIKDRAARFLAWFDRYLAPEPARPEPARPPRVCCTRAPRCVTSGCELGHTIAEWMCCHVPGSCGKPKNVI